MILSVVMLTALLVPVLAISADGAPTMKISLGTPVLVDRYDGDAGFDVIKVPVLVSDNTGELFALRYQVVSDGLLPHSDADNYDEGYDEGDLTTKYGTKVCSFATTINTGAEVDGKKGFQIVQDAVGGPGGRGVSAAAGTLITVCFVVPEEVGSYEIEVIWMDGVDNAKVSYEVTVGDAVAFVKECTAHTPGAAEQTKAPTCTEKGEEVVKCTACQAVIETKEVAALGHKAGEATQTKAPTCTDKGAEEVKCTVCQAVIETKDVAALGHDMVADDAANKAPTCTEAGVKNAKKCSRCDHKTSDVATALGHAWDNGTVDGDAKCGETADVTYKCLNCGEERVETGAKVEHAMVADEANSKAATCTEAGVEATKCSREGCTHTETEAIKALGHDMVADAANSKEATCTEDGVEATKCSRCDVTETKVIKAAHKPGEKEITKEPTTTEKGEAIIKCTVCGEVIETIELDVKSPETSDNANVVVFAVVALVAAAALVVVGKKRFAL
jgi:uncharacterized C2H2 Zn-finger protein